MQSKTWAVGGLVVCLIAGGGCAVADTTYNLTGGTVIDTYAPYPVHDGVFTGTVTVSSNFLVTAANLTFTPFDGSPILSGFSILTAAGYDPVHGYTDAGVATAAVPDDRLYLYIELTPNASGSLTVCGDPNPCPAYFNDASSYFFQPAISGISDFGGAALLVPTPEPSPLVLLGTSTLAALGLARRRRGRS